MGVSNDERDGCTEGLGQHVSAARAAEEALLQKERQCREADVVEANRKGAHPRRWLCLVAAQDKEHSATPHLPR